MENPTGIDQANHSTSQTIAIIVIVIFIIIAFIFVVVISVDIPNPTITPFADGTIVKIRALSNNRYLKALDCSELANYNNCEYNPTCTGGPYGISGGSILIANSLYEQADEWVLCLYKAANEPLIATYSLSKSSRDSDFGIIVNDIYSPSIPQLEVSANAPLCAFLTKTTDLATYGAHYFTFELIDASNKSNSGSTTSGGGIYQISNNAYDNNTRYYWYCDGLRGVLISGTEFCPAPVELNSDPTGQRTDPNNILNYSFSIEPTGKSLS